MLGMEVEPAAYMTVRERLDFAIIVLNFGILVAALAFLSPFNHTAFLISFFSSNSFAILTGQIFVRQRLPFTPNLHLTNGLQQPVGYSADEAGFMGACFLFSGLVAAIITAPLFDRVFTHHLAVTSKTFIPFIAVGWFSFIWAGMSSVFRILNTPTSEIHN